MNVLRGQKGFTLIEVLVSILILSFSLLLFNTFFINSISQTTNQETRQIAMNIARQKIGELKEQEVDESSLADEKKVDTIEINNQSYTSCKIVRKFDPLNILTIHVYQGHDCSGEPLSTLHASLTKK